MVGNLYTDWSPIHCTRYIVNNWTGTGHWAAEQDCEAREPESDEQQSCPENDPLVASKIIANNFPLENNQEEEKFLTVLSPTVLHSSQNSETYNAPS